MVIFVIIITHMMINTHLYFADHHLHQALPSAGQARLTAEQERDDINYISGYPKYHLQLATR